VTTVGWPGRKDVSPKKVMTGHFRGSRPTEKPRGKWEDAVWWNTTNLLQTENWKEAAKNKKGWRQNNGHVTALRQAKITQKKKKTMKKMNLLHTYSTIELPCFPICGAQHVQNVAMYSNNQPWNVLFNPV
jgi:hypothetical protein